MKAKTPVQIEMKSKFAIPKSVRLSGHFMKVNGMTMQSFNFRA